MKSLIDSVKAKRTRRRTSDLNAFGKPVKLVRHFDIFVTDSHVDLRKQPLQMRVFHGFSLKKHQCCRLYATDTIRAHKMYSRLWQTDKHNTTGDLYVVNFLSIRVDELSVDEVILKSDMLRRTSVIRLTGDSTVAASGEFPSRNPIQLDIKAAHILWSRISRHMSPDQFHPRSLSSPVNVIANNVIS